MKKPISLLATLLLSVNLTAEPIGKSIAIVNGEAIYLNDYQNNLGALIEQQKEGAGQQNLPAGWEIEAKKALLDQMIDEKLLLQEAKKRNIKVPKRQIEEGILQVKNRFKILAPGAKPSKEDYERTLTEKETAEFLKELKIQGITEKDFEAKIEDQLRVLRLTEEEVRGQISEPFVKAPNGNNPEEPQELKPEYDREAKALYLQIEKKFNEPGFRPDPNNDVDSITATLKSKLGEMVRASNILVKSSRNDDMKKRMEALNKAKALKTQLDKGADFTDLANTKSETPGPKNGGDLGFFTRGQMLPELEKAAFALPVGGVSDVVETEFGYHLLQVTEKKAARKLKYDDIKVDLAGIIYQKKSRERYEEYIATLKKKAEVKVTLDVSQINPESIKDK